MKLPPHIKPISYLKSHAAEIVKDISESGEAKLVVMDARRPWV